jgi:hypothetical protein
MLDQTPNSPYAETALRRRERAWLEQMIARGRKEPFAEICTITTGIASLMLERNQDNRNKKNARIHEMSGDIAEGRYLLNGQTITFSKEGLLNDGQNRLFAVLETGTPIQTVIVFGVTRESRTTLDIGTPRTVADMIKMEGHDSYASQCAACARLLLGYEKGIYSSSAGQLALSKAAINEFWAENENEISKAIEFTAGKFAARVGHGALAAAYVLLSSKNESDAQDYMGKVIDHSGLPKEDSRFVAHEYLANNRKLRPNVKLNILLRHWNAWCEGKALVRVAITKGAPGRTPVGYPETLAYGLGASAKRSRRR